MLHVAKRKAILMLKLFQFTVCRLYCNSYEIKTMESKKQKH